MSAFEAGIVQGRAEAEQEIADLRAENDRLRAELAAAESTIEVWENPELRAALSESTTGDYGLVPRPERPTSAADATALVGALWVAGVVERGGPEVIERVQRALDYVRLTGR